MKSLKLLAVAAICIGFAGCDTTAFTEDYPDPGTDGLPPYVAFDIGTLETNTWTFSSAENELGSIRTTTTPSGTTIRNLIGLRPRLPMAIGENVEVTYALSGNAVYGTDYQLQVFVIDPELLPSPGGDWQTLPAGDGSFTILYTDENPAPVQVAPHYRDVRIQVLPNPNAAGQRTIQFDLVSASAPSGRDLMIGRFPTNRDNRATVIID